jgi:hypothetical protein
MARGTLHELTATLADRYFPLLAEKMGPVQPRRPYNIFDNAKNRSGSFRGLDYAGGRCVVGDVDVLEKMLLPLGMIPLFLASDWNEILLALWLDDQDEEGRPMPVWERYPGSQFHFEMATELYRARLLGTVPELSGQEVLVVLEAIRQLQASSELDSD